MEKTNKANFMVVMKLRDQITTIVEAEDVASAREKALQQLEHYLPLSMLPGRSAQGPTA